MPPKKQGWSPYELNGGTCVAVAGKIPEYQLDIKYIPETFLKAPGVVIGAGGMHADRQALFKRLKLYYSNYKLEHKKDISIRSAAQVLSTTLYGKRTFPYYAFCFLAGLDEKGNGICYGYDAVGSFQPVKWGAQGSGSSLATAFLDNQIGRMTCKKGIEDERKEKGQDKDLSLDETVDLVKDCMNSVAERDIYTGDGYIVYIITKNGVEVSKPYELAKH